MRVLILQRLYSSLRATRKQFNRWELTTQLFVVLCLLNVVDFQTTATLVNIGGFDVEANPAMRQLMYATGTVWAILIIKAAVLTFLGFLGPKIKPKHRLISPYTYKNVLVLLCVGFSFVCLNNLYLILHVTMSV